MFNFIEKIKTAWCNWRYGPMLTIDTRIAVNSSRHNYNHIMVVSDKRKIDIYVNGQLMVSGMR